MDLISWEVARTYWSLRSRWWVTSSISRSPIRRPPASSRELTRLLGGAIRPVLATTDAIERAIERHRLDWRWEGGRLLGRMF